MTDVLTTVLGLTKQTIGGNRNTWGNILNTNFDSVEEAICGRLSLSASGGTIATLTQAQARKRFIDVTGALLSDGTIIVPNASKGWRIANSTSGDFAVLVKTASGAATSIPAGTSKEVWCDGSDGVFREDINEVGQMAFFGTTAVPSGWWECDGFSARSRAGRGIDLFAKVSTTWGAGNGVTTFGLPNAADTGRFLRSRTASVTVGTLQSDQNKAHTHGVTAVSVASGGAHTHTGTSDNGGADHTHSGTTGIDSVDHTHTYGAPASKVGTFTGSGANGWAGDSTGTTSGIGAQAHTHSFVTGTASAVFHTHTFTTASGGAHSHTLSGTTDSDGGTEARPTNLSAILCIKY